MPLNTGKCSVLHLGSFNPRHQYSLGGVTIQCSDSQSDLGVLVTTSLSWSEHILSVTRKAHRLTFLIGKAFGGCSLEVFAKLYTIYIRPLLEFAGPVWYPTLVRDWELLEAVQRRVTRLSFGVVRPSYEERLRMAGLLSFRDRRLRGDLITTFRAIRGLFGCDLANLFELNVNHLRGHPYKLRKENFSATPRQLFLPNRVFNTWNALPCEVVCAPSVGSFKNRLDQFTGA